MESNEPDRDVLLDHAYDGIKEYDNPMPGWWVWLFVATIVFSFFYVLYYHVGTGPSIYDRLESEQARYGEMIIARFGELKPDEQTIGMLMRDENVISSMAGLYRGRCAQCHAADGSGGVGPNLTNDYYIRVRTLPDIATIISKGVVDRGMPAWEDQFSETQIVLLSAYVAHLRGTSPGRGTAPQGERIPPWPEAPGP